MTQPTDPADFVGCTPDESLLGDDLANLPNAEGRPPDPPLARRTRRRLVAAGATLTGLSLVGGLALIALAIFDAVANGGRLLDLAPGLPGLVLAGTHWGWVHVAEATADAIDDRRGAAARARQCGWLGEIEPYTRHSVTTSVLDDGSIRIARLRHRPVRTARETFTFVREPEGEEVHAADETAAVVAERAEALRRQAALATERERRRWELAADVYQTALLDSDDEGQRLTARHAVSKALSDRINANLRDPPLVE